MKLNLAVFFWFHLLSFWWLNLWMVMLMPIMIMVMVNSDGFCHFVDQFPNDYKSKFEMGREGERVREWWTWKLNCSFISYLINIFVFILCLAISFSFHHFSFDVQLISFISPLSIFIPIFIVWFGFFSSTLQNRFKSNQTKE